MNRLEFGAPTAEPLEKSKRRGDHPGHEVRERLAHQAAVVEARVVEVALDRDRDADAAVFVREQRDCEVERQIEGARGLDALPEREFVEHDLVPGGQPMIDDPVAKIEPEAARFDPAPGERHRVGRQRR
jgi:hypothetical protein